MMHQSWMILIFSFVDPVPVVTGTEPGGIPMTGIAQIITATGTAIVAIIGPIMLVVQLKMRSRDKQRDRIAARRRRQDILNQKQVALKVEEVKLAAIYAGHKIDEVKTTADTIERLSGDSIKISTEALRRSNGALARVLRHIMILTRKIADSDPTPLNIEAAQLAERDYRDHMADLAEPSEPDGAGKSAATETIG